MANDEWMPLAHAFEQHDVKSEKDVRKLWPKGLDRNHLKLGPDGNAHVKVTPELRAAAAKKAQAPQGGYMVPSTMTGGSDTAYANPQQAKDAAIEEMQSNPMAYMRYAQASGGNGIQMNKPVAQFEPMTITASKPKKASAQPKTAQQAAQMADPTASPKGRAAFDAVLASGNKTVQETSAKRGEPLVEVGKPQQTMDVPGLEIPASRGTVAGLDIKVPNSSDVDKALAQTSKDADKGRTAATKSAPKIDKADLIKIAHHALKMHDALAEDE